jgi:D-alanyl-D-alanine dipeptidase
MMIRFGQSIQSALETGKLPMIRVEDVAGQTEFRHLRQVRGVLHELRYASPNNFAGRSLYGSWDCAWVRAEAALGLEAAAEWLARQQPGWRLVVLDALRPQRVQEAIWRSVAGTPLQPYFADPVQGSIHSFGMAVDVTLRDASGLEADMGSGFDEMHPRSHPVLHDEHLAGGSLTVAQVQRREVLHLAMQQGGFRGIPTEWWHFDHGDRDRVRRECTRVY